jgi:hypothetical protein
MEMAGERKRAKKERLMAGVDKKHLRRRLERRTQ